MTVQPRSLPLSARASLIPRPLHRLSVRTRALARRWQSDTQGVAAIEFALIAPLMSVMFIGVIELSQAMAVNRRVGQIANSTGDLVARADTKIQQSDMADIMNVGGYIMLPYSKTPLQIVIRNVTSSTASATQTKQSWTCTFTGTTSSTACSCTNVTQAIPANLVSTNDSVVMVTVTYNYKPLTFDYFMKKNLTSVGGIYGLTQTAYLKPRGQAAMLVLTSGTQCTSPTFP